ncbi:MAG: L-lactate permease [Candidatus Aminicenantes bacterium]|nr:L-lactate permease [Candidatus Aminicenantes bacterium]
MNIFIVLLALLPIIVIFLLLTLRRTAADVAGTIGWIAAVVVAWLYFGTSLPVVFTASLCGVVASFPIALVVATSILQVTIMLETGAIARVVTLIKTVAREDKVAQILLINIGFGTLLTALGAVPVSILPPIMLALGYSSFAAIALPAIGYDALCTYALLGIPVVVFANFVGQPVDQVGHYFARYMPAISTCIAFGMLWIVGRWKMMWKGLIPTLLTGFTAGFVAIGMNALGMITLTGVAAGLAVVIVMLLYLKIKGRKLIDRGGLNEADLAAEKRMPLLAALSPWLILTACSLLMNAPFLPFFNFTFNKLAMPLNIIPGAPEKVRLFWQAYFWILISTLAALPFLKPTRAQLTISVKKWLKRAPRPTFAAAVFFAIAYVINHSGKGADWQLLDNSHNMIYVVAQASAQLFGKLYPLVVPYLGLLGGFISGSETSSIAMLTKLHLSTAQQIGAFGLILAAASGIGGGLASVISPAKLQNAAASIDRIGEEAQVIRTVFVISLVITGVCALLTLLWAY